MTTEKEIKEALVKEFLRTLNVKKVFDAMGQDHSHCENHTKCIPVHLEDFDISFKLPYNFGHYGITSNSDNNFAFAGGFRIRTLNPKEE
jgi:hypothetical protein